MTDTLKETSVSVPNLASSLAMADPCDQEPADPPPPSEPSLPHLAPGPASLLETFAAVARRRASGAPGGGGGAQSTSANNSRNTANSLNNTGIFGRGLTTNSVSSLVRLALSSNFPSGLLNQVTISDKFPQRRFTFVYFRPSLSQV